MPNTAGAAHSYFKRYFYPQVNKPAVIVDERFNGGGSVADDDIDILQRPFIANWAMRYGADLKTPFASARDTEASRVPDPWQDAARHRDHALIGLYSCRGDLMSVLRSVKFAGVLLVLSGTAIAAAQSGGQQMPPMPKPGPEHELLKMDVGTWDAVVEVTPAPGAPAMKSNGVEVNTMGCGGLCLITDFKGDMMGTPFLGHGVATWDPAKKKYVGSWTDSMSTGLAMGESTYDPATKKWTGTMEGPDMTGKVMKSRSVVEYRGATTRVFTTYSPGPDGKEMEGMKITYTKRK